MRISAYARATNTKYANFALDWAGLAGQLGTKAGKALSTPVGAAKLGAGIGAGVGAINYLGSEDKSIGNLAGQVAGGAALGGAAGYGGSSLRNAWQARKAAKQGSVIPKSTPTQTPVTNINSPNNISQPTPTQIPNTTVPNTSSALVRPNGYQDPKALPTTLPQGTYNIANPNTTGAGFPSAKPIGFDKNGRPNNFAPIQPKNSNTYSGTTFPSQRFNPNKPLANSSRNTSPFANFKVRRYNGFVY
jgi:hypothetical protein